MNVYEFINELMFYFPLNKSEEDKRRITNKYADVLISEVHKLRKKYEYEQLLNEILKTYKYKDFPPLSAILPYLDSGIVITPESYSGDGRVIVMITSDNRIYDFVVAGFGSSLTELEVNLRQTYGDVDIRQYPAGSVVLKDRILLFDSTGNKTVENLVYCGASNNRGS